MRRAEHLHSPRTQNYTNAPRYNAAKETHPPPQTGEQATLHPFPLLTTRHKYRRSTNTKLPLMHEAKRTPKGHTTTEQKTYNTAPPRLTTAPTLNVPHYLPAIQNLYCSLYQQQNNNCNENNSFCSLDTDATRQSLYLYRFPEAFHRITDLIYLEKPTKR